MSTGRGSGNEVPRGLPAVALHVVRPKEPAERPPLPFLRPMILFLLGLFLGGLVGFLACALLAVQDMDYLSPREAQLVEDYRREQTKLKGRPS
jgi:hypothetical protein